MSPKRTFDIAFSSFFLLLCAPLLLAIACLIRITSPGPAVFKQVRVGFNGALFVIYKFRTMQDGAHRLGARTIMNDPRITPFGKILRRTCLDELPQLWNVLKGDMSVVGPRPMSIERTRQIQAEIPDFDRRFAILPGLTGPAQILPKGTAPNIRKAFALDLAYIEEHGLPSDLGYIAKTVLVVLGAQHDRPRVVKTA